MDNLPMLGVGFGSFNVSISWTGITQPTASNLIGSNGFDMGFVLAIGDEFRVLGPGGTTTVLNVAINNPGNFAEIQIGHGDSKVGFFGNSGTTQGGPIADADSGTIVDRFNALLAVLRSYNFIAT